MRQMFAKFNPLDDNTSSFCTVSLKKARTLPTKYLIQQAGPYYLKRLVDQEVGGNIINDNQRHQYQSRCMVLQIQWVFSC